MPFDRRNFIQHGGIGMLGLVLADRVRPRSDVSGVGENSGAGVTQAAAHIEPAELVPQDAVPKFTETLPVLPVVDLRNGGQYTIKARSGVHRFHSATGDTPSFGYNSSCLGPVIQVFRDVPVRLTLVNALTGNPLASAVDVGVRGAEQSDRTAPRTSLHLHGGKNQPQFDGHPMDWFRPGQQKTYQYGNNQEAAALWFHDHALGITRFNIYSGLAGAYLIRDRWDDGTRSNGPGLPSGEFELPLILQDRSFNSDGTLYYPTRSDPPAPPAPQLWLPEFHGQIAIVNGRAWPNLDVARGAYRFRIVNASQGTTWNLSLSNAQKIVQIGGDGGLLHRPAPVSKVTLGPGERADVVIDFSTASPGERIVLKNREQSFSSGTQTDRRRPQISEVMQFTVTANKGFRWSAPRRLRPRPLGHLHPADVAMVRNLTLREIMDDQGRTEVFVLNNLPFHDTPDSLIEKPRRNTVEQWNLINLTRSPHPVHLHLVQFRLLGRQRFDWEAYYKAHVAGVPLGKKINASAEPYTTGPLVRPGVTECGLKDTVRANPGEITRLLVSFKDIPFATDRPFMTVDGRRTLRGYIWHCHILEHEEHDMMQRYRLLDT